MISMKVNQNIIVGLLRHIRRHEATKKLREFLRGCLKKSCRPHTREICWRRCLHVKKITACTALSLVDEHCVYFNRDGVIGHLGV